MGIQWAFFTKKFQASNYFFNKAAAVGSVKEKSG